MVFLIENFVNLPADQMASIWLAAHMKRKLQKKDIKKTKLGEACEQLHSDKVKKPLPLRHYGQCLIGISYIHYKQVEYLHNDCNEAFSKARLVLVRKRNVDLDPSKDRGRDITLPEQQQRGGQAAGIDIAERDLIDFDLNENINLSQLYLNDCDAMSDCGSLLGTDSHSGNANDGELQALDHEITMQRNGQMHVISPNKSIRDRRSSFGGISALLMAAGNDMDIEIKFDDEDDDDLNDLDESAAQRVNDADFANLTDTESVEQGRGAMSALHAQSQMVESMIDASFAHPNMSLDGSGSAIGGSHISFAKEKEVTRMNILDDALSAHSGSVIGAGLANMEIDEQSVHSVHVQFDLQSCDGQSVATAALREEEKLTPPSSPQTMRPIAKQKQKQKNKKKKIKKKKKKRFASDKIIEYERDELIESDIANAAFLLPTGRDSLHIWRDYPLSALPFEQMLIQPLSKDLFGKLSGNVLSHFAQCNSLSEKIIAAADRLSNDEEVEKPRDYNSDEAVHDEPMPMQLDEQIHDDLQSNVDEHVSMLDEVSHFDLPLAADDNASTALDSVCNDAFPVPNDALFDEQENHLSFDANDENVLTQMPEAIQQSEDDEQIDVVKPRDWSRRAKKTFAYFKQKEGNEFSFDALMGTNTKRETVVGVFYELLVFKNSDLVNLKQQEAYADITITKTDNFYRHARKSRKLSQR